MSISVFDMFSIGIGPSSSHTLGPMKAARRFIKECFSLSILEKIYKVEVNLYGSLALTGEGHATDKAVQLGLLGWMPDAIDSDLAEKDLKKISSSKEISLLKERKIPFLLKEAIIFHKDKFLPYHPNGMTFIAFGKDGVVLIKKTFYSVGGGFIVSHEQAKEDEEFVEEIELPFPFTCANDLFEHCRRENLPLAELVRCNELFFREEEAIVEHVDKLWQTMEQCISRGIEQEGVLPGGLNVQRRASILFKHMKQGNKDDPASVMDWLSLWALSVNEENAAGGRVVTAPTNGSAGVVPSVIKYYLEMTKNPTKDGVVDFFLVAGVVGILYKLGASISAAEMGCMGEVGVASSMAAAGLTAALGGTNVQIENAAEIAMEHHLGLTCDPIKGLVQIPCIERNTMGALQAVNASRLALCQEDGGKVSLDHVIATMRETGKNMKSMYKETSLGGLAVNVPEC